MANSAPLALTKMRVSAVTGDTVSLEMGGVEVDTRVECLQSYTDRTKGQTVWVVATSPASYLVLGAIAVDTV